MIADIYQKMFLFCGKNRWIYAVTVTCIGLLFFTTLFLFTIASQEFTSYFDLQPYVKSQYAIQLESCTEADIRNVLVHLSSYRKDLQEVSITGITTMENRNGDKSEITVTSYYPQNLSGFYIMNGTSSLDKNDNQILIEYSNGLSALLSTGFFSAKTDQTAMDYLSSVNIAAVGDFDVVGFITSNNNSCLGSIVCNYDKYFAIAHSTNALVIQFNKVLSPEEERSIIEDISSVVKISGITYPDTANQPIVDNYKVTLIMYFGIIFICLLCSIQLSIYYLNLRDQELWVYRLLGISNVYMSGHVLSTILAILIPGMSVGAGIFVLVGYVVPYFNLFEAASIASISYVSVGFFCTSLLVIATSRTAQSFILHKNTITEVRE
jgi:hypothetical protein